MITGSSDVRWSGAVFPLELGTVKPDSISTELHLNVVFEWDKLIYIKLRVSSKSTIMLARPEWRA